MAADSGRRHRGAVLAAGLLMAACAPFSVATPPTPAWALEPALGPDPELVQAAENGKCPPFQPKPPVRVLAEDRRTPSVEVFLLEGDGVFGSCLLQRTSHGISGGGSSGDIPSNAIYVLALDAGGAEVLDDGLGIASYRGGRLAGGEDHLTVTVSLRDGRAVVAQSASGYWLASWQGDVLPDRIVATDSSGQVVGTIEDPK